MLVFEETVVDCRCKVSNEGKMAHQQNTVGQGHEARGREDDPGDRMRRERVLAKLLNMS